MPSKGLTVHERKSIFHALVSAQDEVHPASDEVELLVNGRSLGRAGAGREHRYKAEFETVYEPGTVPAVKAAATGEVAASFDALDRLGRLGLEAPPPDRGAVLRLAGLLHVADHQLSRQGLLAGLDCH